LGTKQIIQFVSLIMTLCTGVLASSEAQDALWIISNHPEEHDHQV